MRPDMISKSEDSLSIQIILLAKIISFALTPDFADTRV